MTLHPIPLSFLIYEENFSSFLSVYASKYTSQCCLFIHHMPQHHFHHSLPSALQMKGRFPFMYSQKWNCYFRNRIIMFCLPVPTTIFLWEIYIFPGSVCLFWCRKYVDWSWEYLNRSQTHECGNWDWGRAIPQKGIHKWDFPYSALPSLNPFWVFTRACSLLSPLPPCSLPILYLVHSKYLHKRNIYGQ